MIARAQQPVPAASWKEEGALTPGAGAWLRRGLAWTVRAVEGRMETQNAKARGHALG